MEHSYFQSRISAFTDGELPADEQARVGEHLEQCSDCQRRLDELWRLDVLTERESELGDSDYWEAAAQRIEARLGSPATEVTDLRGVRAKSRSSLWWKLPAIAASIVFVGYVGLNESDIFKDDLMSVPHEAATPNLLDERLGPPPDDLVEVGEELKMAVEDVELEADRGAADGLVDVPGAPSAVASPSALVPAAPEPLRIAEETEATPAPARTRTKMSTAGTGERESAVGDDGPADKSQANYREKKEKKEKVAAAPVLESLSPATGLARQLFGTSLKETDTQIALDQVLDLDGLRHRRDSLVALIAELDPGALRGGRSQEADQEIVGMASEDRARKTIALAAPTGLPQARTDLVEVWCQICETTENESELSNGIEFLRRIAADDQVTGREEAGACLKAIDQQ